MVGEIAKIGTPSLVASDVKPVPFAVLKIAARFNVKVRVPLRSMQKQEKSDITHHMKNLHERDAFAAAVKSHRIYANRLRQIDSLSIALDKDKLKHLIIQGFSLKNAITMLEYHLASLK